MHSNREIVELSDVDAEYVKYVLETREFENISEYVAELIKYDRGDYTESPEESDHLRKLLEKRAKGPFIEVNKEQLLEEFDRLAREEWGITD